MRHWQILILNISVLSLTGCAGMSANECALADWRAVGYEDGAKGSSSDRFSRHRKSCAKHDVAPDFEAYQSGREAGLREYCQPERGFREGSRGAEYHGVCSGDLEAGFLDSYYDGRTLYDLEYAVNSTKRQIANNKSRMNRIETRLAEIVTAIAAEGTTGDERAALMVETKQLAEERVTLASEVEQLEAQLNQREDALAEHRAQLLTRVSSSYER